MQPQITPLALDGVVLIEPARAGDARGWFSEVFRDDIFRARVADTGFVQENRALSRAAGTVRGLHFQRPPRAQGKLVSCLAGALFDVVVDLRRGAPTYGHWLGAALSAETGRQLWVPAGFAHGFCTLEPDTVIGYRVTDTYSAEHDAGFAWDDPAVGIAWPAIADPATLSAKDRAAPPLARLGEVFA